MKAKITIGPHKDRIVEVRPCLSAKDFWISAALGFIRKTDAILIEESDEKIDNQVNSVTNIAIKIPTYITAEIESTKK